MSDERGALRPLAWARIAVGLIFVARTTPILALFDSSFADASPLLGLPPRGWHPGALGVTGSTTVIVIACVVRTAAAALFLVGWRPLASGVVAAVTGYYAFLQDAFGLTFTMHLLFQATFVLAIADSGVVLAIRPERPRSPASSKLLVAGFLASIYAWAAFVKMRHDWLDGRALGLFVEGGHLRGPIATLLVGTPERRAIAGPAVVLVEFSAAALLVVSRTRTIGVLLAFGLHLTIESMARPDVLGWIMVALLLGCLPAPANEREAAIIPARSPAT